MPATAIPNKVVKILATTFGLTEGVDVYQAPKVSWTPSGSSLEIQVAVQGSRFGPREGNVRPEDFVISVGVLYRHKKDVAGRHGRALSDAAESIFKTAEEVVAALDDSFLEGLLTRPLILIEQSPVRDNPKYQDLLIKEIFFSGGVNSEV